MKTIFPFPTPGALLLLLAALTTASAQSPFARSPVFDPATGLPVTAPGSSTPLITSERPQAIRQLPTPPNLDPTTGLPLPEPKWIDENWSDPDIILTNVMYDNLPLSEVARDLRERFKGQFDILPMPRTFDRDWGSEIMVQLQLKNVRASEVFNAMNLVFENDRTPLRWELKASGHPLALLRVLPEAAPTQPVPASPAGPKVRRVYFVGDLIGDEKSGGMTMDQIVETISDVWTKAYGDSPDVIQFHTSAQLLICNGNSGQNEFIQQTLMALRQKTEFERTKQPPASPASRNNDPRRMDPRNRDPLVLPQPETKSP